MFSLAMPAHGVGFSLFNLDEAQKGPNLVREARKDPRRPCKAHSTESPQRNLPPPAPHPNAPMAALTKPLESLIMLHKATPYKALKVMPYNALEGGIKPRKASQSRIGL